MLAESGFSVVVLEAGKRLDSVADLHNSEANAARIMWTEPRVSTAKHPIEPKTDVRLNSGARAMGTCRMGADPTTTVVNEHCQSHDSFPAKRE